VTVIYSSVINKLFLVTFKLLLAMGINPLESWKKQRQL